MNNLIDRQAAIDAINKHLRRTDVPVSYPGIVSALTEWLNELTSVQPNSKESSSTHKTLDNNNLPSAQPEPHWIPCSERLPDKEGAYIVTNDVGGASGIIFDAFFYCDDGEPTWLLSQNAKAWMELPEPYREDEE